MISFRKHAAKSARRSNSLLGHGRRLAVAAPRVALLTFFLAGAISTPAQSQAQAGARRQGASPAAETPAPAAAASEDASATESRIPIRVTRVETPDGPGVLATIGEFPEDLNEGGQEFLKREFFERFASDVLGVGESGPARATLKVAMLPQEKENQREGDFIFGKVSGHMVVLVEKRRVLIACTFAEAEQKPQLMAAWGGWRAGV